MYGYEKNAGLEGGGKMLHGMKAKKWEERQREKLEKIYSLYKNKMFGRAMQILNQREDAEDAVQNCIIAISRHTECIDLYDEARTLSFVYTVISHCAIDIYRKNKKSRQSNLNIDDVAEQDGNIDIENEVLVSMELKRVVAAIEKLDFGYREVLSLFYLNEMSPREISDLLEIPYNTVRSKISRGRKKLLDSLDGKE